MIDCGQGEPGYVPLLEESLKKISPEAYISDIIITHSHPDHFGGLKDVLSCSSLMHDSSPVQVHHFIAPPSFQQLQHRPFPEDVPVHPLRDDQVFQLDALTTLRVIHTPGHTKDHCAFWLEEEQSLFTADCVLGHGSAVFENLSEYLESLHKLLRLQPKRLYPGHGAVVQDGVIKIQEYIHHRQERENQLIQLLSSSSRGTWTPVEITSQLYQGYPDVLFRAATRGIVLHLQKLQQDGKVEGPVSEDDVVNPMDLQDKEWRWIGSQL